MVEQLRPSTDLSVRTGILRNRRNVEQEIKPFVRVKLSNTHVHRREATVENEGIPLSRGDLFIRLHSKKGGEEPYDDVCEALINKIKEVQTQQPDLSPAVAPNDSYGQVFGVERRGRVRMMGPGPTPSRLFGCTSRGGMSQERAASLEKANEKLNIEVASMREKVSQMEQQMATFLSHFQGLQNCNPPVDPTSSRQHATSSCRRTGLHDLRDDLVVLMSLRREGLKWLVVFVRASIRHM
ncbi:uncharacterized protein LOC143855338 [Tasmannia lanceolata]|uniref:uncharacterized protein LOC143855338 n=1 Tax=Tasmannia lanceolata TaxID=3420 RepID=UPI0040640FFE